MFDSLAAQLALLGPARDNGERIDRIRKLEELKAAIAAAQVREVAAFVSSHTGSQRARGLPADRAGRGVAAQVGLARRISPFEAARYVSAVRVLVADLPSTLEALRAGTLSERRAVLVAQQVAWLSPEHRRAVDDQVAPAFGTMGTRRLIDTVKRAAYRLDPHGYLDRLHRAEDERHVSVRPIADNVARLSAELPLPQAVAAYAALRHHADSAAGVGPETRTRSQLMADTLVERITGQASATAVNVQVNLLMTDQALLNHGAGSNEPATLIGGGTIPATLARRLVTDSARACLRKLYADRSGRLVAMESRTRLFTDAQRHFLILRDQRCRTPWCDAPIRHADHVVPAERGGTTSIDNGQGLCEACNHAKQADGWVQFRRGEEIITLTPTGHLYRSRAPARLAEELGRAEHSGHRDLDDYPSGVDPRLTVAS